MPQYPTGLPLKDNVQREGEPSGRDRFSVRTDHTMGDRGAPNVRYSTVSLHSAMLIGCASTR